MKNYIFRKLFVFTVMPAIIVSLIINPSWAISENNSNITLFKSASIYSEYFTRGTYDLIEINNINPNDVNVSRNTFNESIEIAFKTPNLIQGNSIYTTKTDAVKKIVVTGGLTSKIIAFSPGQKFIKLFKKDNYLGIKISSGGFNNLNYNSHFDKRSLTISNCIIAEDDNINRKYTEEYSTDRLTYSVKFLNNLANLDTGNFYINDKFLNSINISKDDSYTTIQFNSKIKLYFLTISRLLSNNTSISFISQEDIDKNVVVIDAGHGGVEPGAISNGITEKLMNLDIATRVYNKLKDLGIPAYMTRQDDSYIGLYERAYYANILKSPLFLSIHFNAYNSSMSGTETLYYPTKDTFNFTGKSFAQIIQNSLINAIGLNNRGLIERPNLVVLNSTDMPSALAEIGFITNSKDRQVILKEKNKDKVADSLVESVIEAYSAITGR